jgi:hypothetical protein
VRSRSRRVACRAATKVVSVTRDATIVVLQDIAENILDRITFYDIDSRPMSMNLTDREKGLYLGEIKTRHRVLQPLLPQSERVRRHRRL